MKKIFFVLFIQICGIVASYGQVNPHLRSYLADQDGYLRETTVDYSHLLLNVSFDCPKGIVNGKVTHTFKVIRSQIDSLFLDGINMNYSEVLLDGNKVEFTPFSQGITLHFTSPLKGNSEHKITIQYQCKPEKGIYFIGWNDPTNRSRKQIWTQGEAHDNRHWIPMFDDFYDKVISEVYVTFPSEYKVLSNGSKVEELLSGRNTIWHYRMNHPHAVYLIMLGIGQYDITSSKSSGGTPLNKYMYPDQKDRQSATYTNTERFLSLFEEETRVKYPWGSYSQIPVQDFIYGAMENTSATIFGDFFNVTDRHVDLKNYKSVNAHEMAHQWFGDLITCRAGRHMWLNESFATHYQKTIERVTEGENYYQYNRFREMQSALDEGQKNSNPIVHSQAGTARLYQKGSLVLDMMRNVAGNENYKKAINYYLNKFKFQNVTTYDLLMSFHDACGIDLTSFFEQWIFKGGEPKYEVNYELLNKKIQFNIKQIQAKDELVGLFNMPIDFLIAYKDGTKQSFNKIIKEENVIFDETINSEKEIDYIVFDDGHKVLSQINFKRSTKMLLNQALRGNSFINRYEALIALKDIPFAEKRETFEMILHNMSDGNTSNYYPLVSEILIQSKNEELENITSIFVIALDSKDPQVLNAVAINYPYCLKNVSLFSKYRSLLNSNELEVVKNTFNHSVELNLLPKTELLSLTEKDSKIDNILRVNWLKTKVENQFPDGVKNENSSTELAELVDFASQSFEFRTRKEAIEKLSKLNYIGGFSLDYIADALMSKNGRLKNPVIEYINNYKKIDINKELFNQYYIKNSGKWSPEKQKELKDYFTIKN